MMDKELLLLNKIYTDTLTKQTKIEPQGTLDYELNKQLKSFPFSQPIKLVEEGKWLLSVSSFEATNSIFYITNGNNSFSISKPGHWKSEDGEELNTKLNRLLELRSENDIKLTCRRS